MWPQIIYIILTAIGMGMVCQQHGEPKTGTHNGYAYIGATILTTLLLYWGGFFDPLFK